jgi:hypothetical protein
MLYLYHIFPTRLAIIHLDYLKYLDYLDSLAIWLEMR